jgi:ABC-type tungstate transport system permease subunit
MSYAPRHIVFNGRLYRMTPGEWETAMHHLSHGKAAAYALKQANAQDLGTVQDVTNWEAYDARTTLDVYYGTAQR